MSLKARKFAELEFLLFLRADGTGFRREYWNRADIELQHPISRHEWLEGSTDVLSRSTQTISWKEIAWRIEQIDFPDDVNWRGNESNLEWLCGSRGKSQKVLNWICWSEIEFWGETARSTQAVLCFEVKAGFLVQNSFSSIAAKR